MAQDHEELRAIARQIRKDIIRQVAGAQSGHAGSSLSAVEIGVALYWREMRLDPSRPDWPDRDRFCLSKGHASPLLYALLARRGFFPPEELDTFRRINSRLQGHPARHKLPGVEISAGSLGQGLSQAIGMALAARLDGRPYRVYALLGDGELQEGQIWEAAMFAANHGLDNLCAIVDYNGFQIDGPVAEINDPAPVAEKFRAFRWHAVEIDGHDYDQIFAALAEARQTRGRPTCIVARTRKGRGIAAIEDTVQSHSWYPKVEELEALYEELDREAAPVARGPAEEVGAR